MNTTVLLIPGFGEYPETLTFKDLKSELEQKGYVVNIISWPHYPNELDRYSFTETLKEARIIIQRALDEGSKIILHGNSMGGILAIKLATEFPTEKLSLTVTPYQAGTEDDLAGKYKDWQETGFREFTSSKYGTLIIPFLFIIDARQYNALDFIKDVHCPTLFITGQKDMNVPWQTTKKLFEKANEPKEWHCLEDMEHKFQYQPEKLKVVNEHIQNFYTN